MDGEADNMNGAKSGVKRILEMNAAAAARKKAAKAPGAKSAGKNKDKSNGNDTSSSSDKRISALLTSVSLLSLSMASRIRSLESMVMWCVLIPSDCEICDIMKECTKNHSIAIREAKSGGAAFKLEAPVHVIAWIGVMEFLSLERLEMSS